MADPDPTFPASQDLTDAFFKDLSQSVNATLQLIVQLLGSGSGSRHGGTIAQSDPAGQWLWVVTSSSQKWTAPTDCYIRNVIGADANAQWVVSYENLTRIQFNALASGAYMGRIIAWYGAASNPETRLMKIFVPKKTDIWITTTAAAPTDVLIYIENTQ